MPSKDQDRIFLCHAYEDKSQVIEIYHRLRAAGLNPWLDEMDLLPGQQWDREIRRVLKNSRFIMIFFSQNSVAKRGYVQREFKLALDTLEEIPDDMIFVIPIRLDNCKIPKSFKQFQYTDLFGDDDTDKVLRVINMELFKSGHKPFSTGQFHDPRDEHTYETVLINGQIWMAENLNFDVGKGCWFYDENPENGKKYGRLYTWDAAIKACPQGWRLPSDKEWESLRNSFGGEYQAYYALSENGHSGFNALLGGIRDHTGSFSKLGERGYYWSSVEKSTKYAVDYHFIGSTRIFKPYTDNKRFGFSCRCVKA